jgi:hypothetical protein
MLHRQALASRNMSEKLRTIFQAVKELLTMSKTIQLEANSQKVK